MEPPLPDYYAVLGVGRMATADEIRKAFIRLSLANHPDRGGSLEKAQAIGEAYAVLRDRDKRVTYDAKLHYYGTQPAEPTRPAEESPHIHHRDTSLDWLITNIRRAAEMSREKQRQAEAKQATAQQATSSTGTYNQGGFMRQNGHMASCTCQVCLMMYANLSGSYSRSRK